MGDRSPVLLGSLFSLLATSWITFALRLWVRGFLLKTWGLDDWLMVVSIAFFTAYSISEAVGVAYGTGKHIEVLEPDRAQVALVTWWLCELFYIICTVFLKLSVGVFLHRIAINRWHIWIIRIMTVCTAVFGFAYFLVGVFMCWPVQAFWIRKHDVASRDYGSCIPDAAIVGLTYAAGSLNSIADLTFGLIPFFIIKDLNMPKKSKRLVACILTFANIACVATIVRMAYIKDLYNTDDWLYATAYMVTWCTVEIGVGITAACFATLRPLLRIVFGLRASQWFPEQPSSGRIDKYTSNLPDISGASSESYTMNSAVPKLRPDHVGHYTEISSAGSRQCRGRAREKRDPRITGKAMRDLYSTRGGDDDDEVEGENLSTKPSQERGRSGAISPSLEIRKNFEFSYSVKERGADEMDDYEMRVPPTAATQWQSETAAQYARNTAAITRQASMEQPREGSREQSREARSDDDRFHLPMQKHSFERPR